MELPVLGRLFKSNDYVNQRTELMVLVTPYVVRAVAQKDFRGLTTALPTRAILHRFCLAASIASTASVERRSAGQLSRQIRLHSGLRFGAGDTRKRIAGCR